MGIFLFIYIEYFEKNKMKIAISIIATLLGVTNGAKDHCYALTMAGGGTKGAYEAGVLWGMIDAA